jgi:tetraacyldisaccharide 4'-kinase
MARTAHRVGGPVALVSRGYGEDEILLHRRWNPGIPVFFSVDRVVAATEARDGGARVVILDDGFQHRRLARDLDVVLLAAEDPFPGRLLPRGPYRERPDALERAQAVVVTRRTAAAPAAEALACTVGERFPHLTVALVALLPGGWQDLAGAPAPPPEGPVLAVSGIAKPEAFAVHVGSEIRGEVESMEFPDHHPFSAADVKAMRERARGRTVVVTQKDAVKLQPYGTELDPVRVLGQKITWETGEEALTRLVCAAAAKDR